MASIQDGPLNRGDRNLYWLYRLAICPHVYQPRRTRMLDVLAPQIFAIVVRLDVRTSYIVALFLNLSSVHTLLAVAWDNLPPDLERECNDSVIRAGMLCHSHLYLGNVKGLRSDETSLCLLLRIRQRQILLLAPEVDGLNKTLVCDGEITETRKCKNMKNWKKSEKVCKG